MKIALSVAILAIMIATLVLLTTKGLHPNTHSATDWSDYTPYNGGGSSQPRWNHPSRTEIITGTVLKVIESGTGIPG